MSPYAIVIYISPTITYQVRVVVTTWYDFRPCGLHTDIIGIVQAAKVYQARFPADQETEWSSSIASKAQVIPSLYETLCMRVVDP